MILLSTVAAGTFCPFPPLRRCRALLWLLTLADRSISAAGAAGAHDRQGQRAAEKARHPVGKGPRQAGQGGQPQARGRTFSSIANPYYAGTLNLQAPHRPLYRCTQGLLGGATSVILMSMILLFKKIWTPPAVSPPFSVGDVYKPNMQLRVHPPLALTP
eukprot:61526-Prorocentrum_minimum.AAC.2